MAMMSQPVAAQPHESLKLSMESYAGYFHEQCVRLEVGQTLRLTLESPYTVRLNVHRHAPERTLFLIDALVGGSMTDMFDIPSDGEYCLQVTNPENRASPFELRLDYRVDSHS